MAEPTKAYGCGQYSLGCKCELCLARDARHEAEFRELPANETRQFIRATDTMVLAMRFSCMGGPTPAWVRAAERQVLEKAGWL